MIRPSRSAALALAFSLLSSFEPASAQQAAFQPGAIFRADAKLESVFSGGFFLEGPAAAPDGTVYFSDITITAQAGGQAGYVWRFDPRTGKTTLFRSPSGMNSGNRFDADAGKPNGIAISPDQRTLYVSSDGTRESLQDQDADGRIPSVREVISIWPNEILS